VVVSHDRYFLDRTVDRLFCFENGELQRFEGNYSAYLDREAANAAAGAAAAGAAVAGSADPAPAPAPQPAVPARPRRRSFRENRELADLEVNLPAWEERRSALEAQLAAGAPGGDYTALERLSEELSALLIQIERGEERWLELSELAG
jgi:ATP-binding cassette subfamily F protein uup